MAGRWDLGFPNRGGASSLKEQLARTTLNNVRSRGHPYVELREDGKRFIFFCTLCLAPCYSDSILFDHLRGNLHTERLSTAKLTLLKDNPWPFSDGVHFFDNSYENEKQLIIEDDSKSPRCDSANLAIVEYDGVHSDPSGDGDVGFDKEVNDNEQPCDLLIEGVLLKDDVSNLRARFIGFGQIAARFVEKKDDNSNEIIRIWCEWLGVNAPDHEDNAKILDHDFAFITFAYSYDLGRQGFPSDVKLLLSSTCGQQENDNTEHGANSRKRKKSLSDPEDLSRSFSNQYDSAGEDSMSSSSGPPTTILSDQPDDHLLRSRIISSKTIRRELRRQHRIAAERICDICQQKILPEKDVATLINMKTGKLACCSRNPYGQFHVFHTSCLIHWILLSEYEMHRNRSVSPKGRKSRRKNGSKCTKAENVAALNSQIVSVFCPECQGTGAILDQEELERATIPLSEMFKYKIKVSDGRRAWMRSPELLENCSIGFHFPSKTDKVAQEKLMPLKLLRFYRADEQQSWT